ncbi:hypothetical protein [Mucilaginibacter xinganensis]|uniref:Uncharacterized protein n=1 Tax=Mucilaginibacter xinganensis TaxID=1234841 RepID=A0A223P142_9SPHI|nr:hypothetical protein [Mucilaginibacter xinganensis]ASU35835.1 hypothetical protein MuYL_3950 [Mucilaginibacter xinganensis]
MSKFYKQLLEHQLLDEDNTLVTIKKSLKLIEGTEYYNQLIDLFKIDVESSEIIPLKGLNTLINSILAKDQQFKKFDYQVNLSDVSLNRFTESGSAILNILLSKDQTSEDKEKVVIAETVYNSKSDYFESAYKLDTFAKFCQKEGHLRLLKDNIDHLNEHYHNSNDFNKNFRLLKDQEGTYVRAITSTSHYNNYGNRFSLFVAIISLKNLMTSKGLSFKINRAEYDESVINVFFEKTGVKNIKGVGQVKFIVEMSNDEIKRGAMKFAAVFSIIANGHEVYVKPEKLKTELVSIQHNFKTDTVFKYLGSLNDFIEQAETEVMNDIGELGNINKPDELRHLLLRKVEAAKNIDVKKNKVTITKLLQNKINSLSELIVLMNKVDLIVSNLETKEYLRYMFYDVLKGKK